MNLSPNNVFHISQRKTSLESPYLYHIKLHFFSTLCEHFILTISQISLSSKIDAV